MANLDFSRQSAFVGKLVFFIFLIFAVFPLSVFASDVPGEGNDYLLGASDRIEIVVFGEEDLSVERTVNSRGMISYPLLGGLSVKGLTVGQVSALLEDKLRGDYLITPQINVSVLEYRRVFVRGEVKDPGGFSYIPGLTIGKAIALAGGFSERASRKSVEVSRELKNGLREDLKLGIGEVVNPGDILIVNESFF